MTVSDLREYLEGLDDDQIVYFSYDFGDHWHTPVCQEIDEVNVKPMYWSGYHTSYVLADEDKEPTEGEEIVSGVILQ